MADENTNYKTDDTLDKIDSDKNTNNKTDDTLDKIDSEDNNESSQSDYYMYQNFYGGYYTNYTAKDSDGKEGYYFQYGGAYYSGAYNYTNENNTDPNSPTGGK